MLLLPRRLTCGSLRSPRRLLRRGVRLAGGQALRGERDRLDDELVARAAAEVAGDCALDLLATGPRVALEQVERRHEHARRAVAALERVRLVKSLLQGVENPSPR